MTVIDNLTTGKKENLQQAGPDVDFHEGDIRDRVLLQKVLAGVDVVFHQAAVVSVPLSVEQPLASAAVNEHRHAGGAGGGPAGRLSAGGAGQFERRLRRRSGTAQTGETCPFAR